MNEADNVEVTETEAPVEATAERPEWLPEKFKTPEDLVSSYSHLETKLGKSDDELRSAIKEEIHQEQWADRPPTVGDYTIPDALDEEAAVGDDLLNWWAQFSYDHGFGQDKFEAGIEKYVNAINGGVSLEEEHSKLGENADARIEAVKLWSNQFFDESQFEAVERLGETAQGIEVLEKIMSAINVTPVSGNVEASSQLSEDELRSMMMDERYWKQGSRDQSFVKRVEDGFSKIYQG
jgi:hypothetical protein